MALKEFKGRMLPSAPSSTLTVMLSMPLQCGSFNCKTEDLGFALWICVIAYAGHRLWPGNGRKRLFKEFNTSQMVLKGIVSMEVFSLISMEVCTFSMEVIWMVLKGGWLHAVGTFGCRLASRPGMTWLTFALVSSGCTAGLFVPGSRLLRPTLCTEVVFIATLVTFFAPCWAFSRQVGHSTLTAYLTITFGSLALTFPLLEGPDLVYCGCHCNSSIGLVSLEVLDSCLVLLGML